MLNGVLRYTVGVGKRPIDAKKLTARFRCVTDDQKAYIDSSRSSQSRNGVRLRD